jgi:hypothetical protein
VRVVTLLGSLLGGSANCVTAVIMARYAGGASKILSKTTRQCRVFIWSSELVGVAWLG